MRAEDQATLTGSRVYVVSDPEHVGTVERVRGNQAFVRWHKGYATWEAIAYLRLSK